MMLGETGKTYQLTIRHNGQEYQSTTTIPSVTKTIDSLWSDKVPNRPANDSFRVLKGSIFDPPGLGNYIRYFTQVNNQPFSRGLTVCLMMILLMAKSTILPLTEGSTGICLLKEKTTVSLNWEILLPLSLPILIKPALNSENLGICFQSIGNPFSSPGVVKGNISNGALGVLFVDMVHTKLTFAKIKK